MLYVTKQGTIFGINYLEDYVKTLSQDEINDRANFAYEFV